MNTPSGFFRRRGELIAIDPRGLNDFYKDLKSVFGHFVGAAAVIGMWAPESGDGLYTRASAASAKTLIKNVIDGDINIGQNWPALKDATTEFKDKDGANYDRTWKSRGNVYTSIVARKRGRRYEIGVDRRKKVTPTGFSTFAGTARLAEKIPVERYAAWVEYGTAWMAPRPLFGPANIYFSTKYGPFIKTAVARSINRVANKYKPKLVGSRHATGSAGAFTGSYSMASANPEGDFSATILANLVGEVNTPGSGLSSSKYAGSDGSAFLVNSIKKDLKYVKNGSIKICGSSEDMDNAEAWLSKHENLI